MQRHGFDQITKTFALSVTVCIAPYSEPRRLAILEVTELRRTRASHYTTVVSTDRESAPFLMQPSFPSSSSETPQHILDLPRPTCTSKISGTFYVPRFSSINVQVEQMAHDQMVKKMATEKLDANNDLVKMLNSLGARAAAFTIRDKQASISPSISIMRQTKTIYTSKRTVRCCRILGDEICVIP